MRYFKIKQYSQQIYKLRLALEAGDTPARKIKRPEGMKKYLFEEKLARLKKLEKLARAEFRRGMLIEIKRSLN